MFQAGCGLVSSHKQATDVSQERPNEPGRAGADHERDPEGRISGTGGAGADRVTAFHFYLEKQCQEVYILPRD